MYWVVRVKHILKFEPWQVVFPASCVEMRADIFWLYVTVYTLRFLSTMQIHRIYSWHSLYMAAFTGLFDLS